MVKAPNDTVRIAKGQFEALRHINREREVKYDKLIKHLIGCYAYTSPQWAKETIKLFIKTKVIDRKENDILRLTAVGKKLLEILELLLQMQHK